SFGFIVNKGQIKDENGISAHQVLLNSIHHGLTFFVTTKGFTYILQNKDSSIRMDASFLNANISTSQIEYSQPLNDAPVYFYSGKSTEMITQFYYSKIKLKNIYKGIDLILTSTDSSIEYSFEVEAGASVQQIQLRYTGCQLQINQDGDLLLKNRINEIKETHLKSFQNGKQIATHFSISDSSTITFVPSEYNINQTIIIDPTIVWSTNFGGNNCTENGVAINKNDDFLICGSTYGNANFPLLGAGSYYSNGSLTTTQAFISKFNKNMRLLWSIQYGGVGNDYATAIAVDNSNSIFVSGVTNSEDFYVKKSGASFIDSTLNDSLKRTFFQNYDAFVLKLNNNGVLQYATYLGGDDDDFSKDISVDASGNIVVVGSTQSNDFLIKSSSGYNQSNLKGTEDGFLIKLNNNGALQWSTYFGGTKTDAINSVSIDASSSIFVCGFTNSRIQFPLQNNGGYFDNNLDTTDFFVSKFTSTQALNWSTYFGGSKFDFGAASVIDKAGNLYVAGNTNSNNAPIYKNSSSVFYDSTLNNGVASSNPFFSYDDILLAKFSNTGSRLWATYLGGEADESIYSGSFQTDKNNQLSIDKCNNLYVCYGTNSKHDTLLNLNCNSYFDNTFGPTKLLKIDNHQNLKWATYFGNSFGMFQGCIVNNSHSNLYATNPTQIFPTAYPAPFAYYNNSGDVILSRLDYLPFTAGVNSNLCGVGCNGNASVLISSACSSSSFSYLWSNGSTANSLTNLCAGNYFVIVNDTSVTCSSDTIHFKLKSGIQAYPQVSAMACPTTCNGAASITLPASVGSVQYQWHVNDTIVNNIPSVYDLCPQQDTLILSTSACGSDTVIFNIQPYPYLMLYRKSLTIGDLIPCPLECNSIAQYVISGGQQAATTIWNNGVIGPIANNLCAGNTYTITATDSVCYYTSATVTIPNPVVPFPTITNSFTAATCKPIYTVQANLFNGGHQKPYHYLWNTGDTTATIDSVGAGTYTCIISDSCKTYNAVTCTISPFIKKPFHVSIISSVPNCDSILCNGVMGVNISQINNFYGIAPYSYYWNGVQGTNTYDSACLGKKYKLMVIDACADTMYDSIIYNVAYSFGLNVSYDKLLCFDSCSYRASILPHGTSPFTYLWFDSTTLNYHYNLCKDSVYHVIVGDACGNKDTVGIYPSVPPFKISASTSGYTSCCIGVVSVTVVSSTGIVGGKPPYHFFWSTGSTQTSIDSVCAGIAYWVIGWDSCGAKDSIYFITPNIQSPSFAVTVNTTGSCSNLCTGSASANIYQVPLSNPPSLGGGVPPYSFSWSNGINGSTNSPGGILDVFNLCNAQVIHCTVTDDCGTMVGSFAQVPLTQSLSLNMGSSPSCIGTCNGIAYAYASNGSPPYTYIWNDTIIGTNSYYQACAGQKYKCKIIDACGDSAIDTVTIPILQPLTANVSLANTKCNFNCGATATVSYSGGQSPYFVAWNTGLLNTNSLTNLCADSMYNVVVSSLGCAAKRIKFRVPTNPILTLNKVFDDSTCANSCTGKIKVKASGGQLPYNYSWSNGSSSTLITNLCAGIYTCIVTDFCGKKDTLTDTIYAHSPLHGFILKKQNSCNNICNGTAKISQYGGAPPYTYLWSNGQTSQQATNLCKGSNYCIVHDSCGYNDTVRFVIQSFPLLKDSLIITKKISCLSSCNGAAKIIHISGKAPYTYLWSNGNVGNSTNTLCAGNNFCIVSDSCGLKDTIAFKIDSISSIKIDSVHFANSSCNEICTGSASIFASGGQPPLTYLWSNGATTNSISNLCPGKYFVKITNPNCLSDSLFDSVEIKSNFHSNATITKHNLCFDSCKGAASISVSGGTPPYHYYWSNGVSTSAYNKLCTDTFIVKVNDNVGCAVYDTIIISSPPKLFVNSILTPSHCYNHDGKIVVQVNGGTKPYNYLWSNGANSNTDSLLTIGKYQVMITDSNQCKISKSFQITGLYPTVFVSNDTLVGGGDTVKLNAYGTKYFHWFPSNNLSCDTCKNPYWIGIEQQNICVIGIDTFGCSDTACLVISTFDNCGNIVLPKAFTPNNDGVNDVFKPLAHYPDCFVEIDFKIFDRWGMLLFQSNNINQGWDGTYKNVQQPQDSYAWILTAKNYYGRKITLNGNVTIIR
ncbi:MAG: gliding motility protein SprB, partial [Bacteroidota bacterium]